MHQEGLQLRMRRHKETEHQRKGKVMVIKREDRAHHTNCSTSQLCLGPAGYRFKVVLAHMLPVTSLSLGPPGAFVGPLISVPMEVRGTICLNI